MWETGNQLGGEMTNFPNFTNPPVVELVLGVQFSPLTKLTAGHYGLFWKELGEDWTNPVDAPLLDDQFELFDHPPWTDQRIVQLRLEPVRLPGRFSLEHRDQHRRIQLQPTRFHFNWRKRDGFYPSYRRLISEFEAMCARFATFVEAVRIGKLVPNQWELTYVDAFPQGEYWQSPTEWSNFLPGLFGILKPADGLTLDRRAAEWSFEIAPQRGRLHITAQTGRTTDGGEPSLLLQMTARGPIGKAGAESLRTGLDVGHDAAVGTFLRVTSDEAKERWGKQL